MAIERLNGTLNEIVIKGRPTRTFSSSLKIYQRFIWRAMFRLIQFTISISMAMGPLNLTYAADHGSTPSRENIERALDNYTLSLYETLVAIHHESVSPEDLNSIRDFISIEFKDTNKPFNQLKERAKRYRDLAQLLQTQGARGCLSLEYSLNQLLSLVDKFSVEEPQWELRREIRSEIQIILLNASCFSPSFNVGYPVNVAADFTLLKGYLDQILNLQSSDKNKSALSELYTTYTATALLGITEAHFFNVARIQRKFSELGIPFKNLEDLKSRAFKEQLYAKAKASGLLIASIAALAGAYAGSGFAVRKGMAYATLAERKWNKLIMPNIGNSMLRWTGGLWSGQIRNLEKASYVLSAMAIGGLGGGGAHDFGAARDLFLEANKRGFDRNTNLGAELMPLVAEELGWHEVAHHTWEGAKVGIAAGGLLTAGVLNYPMPHYIRPNLLRHATLVVLASAVAFSTGLALKQGFSNFIDAQENLKLANDTLNTLSSIQTTGERQAIIDRARSYRSNAYGNFNEVVKSVSDLAILGMLDYELFYRGELRHIWNAKEAHVAEAMSKGSDEVPSAANGIMSQGSPAGSDAAAGKVAAISHTSDDVGAAASHLVAATADDVGGLAAGKGIIGGKISAVGMKSLLFSSPWLAGRHSNSNLVLPSGEELNTLGTLLDVNSSIPIIISE